MANLLETFVLLLNLPTIIFAQVKIHTAKKNFPTSELRAESMKSLLMGRKVKLQPKWRQSIPVADGRQLVRFPTLTTDFDKGFLVLFHLAGMWKMVLLPL